MSKKCLVQPWRVLSCSWLFDLLKSPPFCWWLPQPCDKSEPQKTPKPPHFARVRKVSLERLGEDFFNQLRARVASSSSGSSSLRPLIVAMGTRGDAARLKVGPVGCRSVQREGGIDPKNMVKTWPFPCGNLHGKMMTIWLVVWNIWIIFPYIGNSNPNWRSYFSEGLKPPTSNFLIDWNLGFTSENRIVL